MAQQRVLALGADTRDFVERRPPDRLDALGAMRADGEAMRLVAQSLQEVQYRIPRLQRERWPAGHEEPLAAGVAVGTLGDRDEREIRDTEFREDLLRRRQLALSAVDQHEIRP